MINFYSNYRDAIKTGDLLEAETYSIIGRLIRYFTKKDVNHSAFLFHLEEVTDRVYRIEALSKGVELNRLSKSIEGFQGRVYWYPLKESADEARDSMLKVALDITAEEKNYDYGNVFAQIFGKVSLDAKYFFCSEFYHYILREVGLVDKDIKALRPGEFDKLGLHHSRILLYDSRGDDGS